MSAVASAQLRELKYKLGKFSVLKDLPGPEYWAAKSRSDLTLAVREQMPATRPFEAKLAALQSKFNSLTSKVRGYTDNAFVASSSSSSSFAAAGSATMATAEATSRCKPDINTTQGIDDTTVLAHPSSSSSSVSQPALSSSSSSSSSSAAAAAAAGPSVFHTYAKPRSKRVPRKKNAAVRPPAAIVGASRKKKSSRAKANLRKQSKPQTHARTHTQPEPNAIPASVDSSVIAVAHAAQREREGLAAKIEALEHKVQENRALKQLNALEVEAKADAKLQARLHYLERQLEMENESQTKLLQAKLDREEKMKNAQLLKQIAKKEAEMAQNLVRRFELEEREKIEADVRGQLNLEAHKEKDELTRQKHLLKQQFEVADMRHAELEKQEEKIVMLMHAEKKRAMRNAEQERMLKEVMDQEKAVSHKLERDRAANCALLAQIEEKEGRVRALLDEEAALMAHRAEEAAVLEQQRMTLELERKEQAAWEEQQAQLDAARAEEVALQLVLRREREEEKEKHAEQARLAYEDAQRAQAVREVREAEKARALHTKAKEAREMKRLARAREAMVTQARKARRDLRRRKANQVRDAVENGTFMTIIQEDAAAKKKKSKRKQQRILDAALGASHHTGAGEGLSKTQMALDSRSLRGLPRRRIQQHSHTHLHSSARKSHMHGRKNATQNDSFVNVSSSNSLQQAIFELECKQLDLQSKMDAENRRREQIDAYRDMGAKIKQYEDKLKSYDTNLIGVVRKLHNKLEYSSASETDTSSDADSEGRVARITP